MRASLLVEASSIEQRIEEAEYPDDLTLLPRSYAGPELIAVTYANTLATLTPHGRRAVALPVPTATALIASARLARTEVVEPGVDTALSRTSGELRAAS